MSEVRLHTEYSPRQDTLIQVGVSSYGTKLLMLSVTTSVTQAYLLGYLRTMELGALGLSRTLLQRSFGGCPGCWGSRLWTVHGVLDSAVRSMQPVLHTLRFVVYYNG
jgi:hypothetical protein